MTARPVHDRDADSQKGFVFVTCGAFSGTNASLVPLLEASFPELALTRFDVADWVHGARRIFAANLASALLEYGPPALIGRAELRQSFYRTAYLQRRIRKAMRRRTSPAHHAFTFQTQSMFDASVPGIPHFVYTDHTALANTYYPGFERSELPSKAWLAREREIYENASLTFTWSSHVSRSLVELYGISPDRVSCVFAGANVDSDPGAPARAHGKQILFAGRDWQRKGGPQLLAAFEIVRERHPDATLVVAGCSPQIDLEGVTVLGDIAEAELGEQYRRSIVFCMPTRVEPFGIVIVEALAHGLPVVATSIGALPDIVQDGESGILVGPDDVAGLAGGLVALLDDPAMARRFGELGRERMLQRYTWPRVVEAMAGQIRTVLAAR